MRCSVPRSATWHAGFPMEKTASERRAGCRKHRKDPPPADAKSVNRNNDGLAAELHRSKGGLALQNEKAKLLAASTLVDWTRPPRAEVDAC